MKLALSQEELPHHAAMSEVAIHISNHTIHKRDRGLVVVGASSRLGELGDGFGAPWPLAFRVAGFGSRVLTCFGACCGMCAPMWFTTLRSWGLGTARMPGALAGRLASL